jgi:hypothetical protein
MLTISINKIPIEITYKNIKNVYLRIYPPNGEVKVSAPKKMPLDTIRLFITSKSDWIKQQQKKIKNQQTETPKNFIDQEKHYFNGKQYQLKIVESIGRPKIELNDKHITMHTPPNTSIEQKKKLLNNWYRTKLKETIPILIRQYEPIMKVSVAEFGIKQMKTKWGTCNPRAKRIWINLELAKKSPECLEYLVVHEMAHLLEPSHNHRFKSLMTTFLPNWKQRQKELNKIAIQHEK